jgi:DNA-binding protein H-NS
MNKNDFKSLSLDRLWDLREEIVAALAAKMIAEKSVLEDRLRKLNGHAQVDRIRKARRSYPTVLPKYRNPNQPSETWAGRGKKPRWLAAALKLGKRLDDFRI